MGLKSGSRDAEYDDEEESAEGEKTNDGGGDRTAGRETSENERTEETGGGGSRPTAASIPYKLRRNKVNEGRDQVPFFLREEVMDAGDDLHATLEEMLGEDVYKSDYREAAMVVAQRNPELVAEVLREWGYDIEGI